MLKNKLNNLDLLALHFNDIILIPQYSEVKSRLDVNLSTQITKKIKLKIPICSTNMSSITELNMVRTITKLGGCGFFHRFMTFEDQCIIIDNMKKENLYPIIPSIGVKDYDYCHIKDFVKMGVDAFLIDIAHGHSINAINMLKYIKDKFDIEVIVGSIATPEGAYDLYNNGADCVRLGVSGGSFCLTKYVTGHGLPTLQSIIDCKSVCNSFKSFIISDGGYSTGGDIVKGLAFGSDAIMLGGLLAASSDTPGKIIKIYNKKYKEYYGMASREAQERYKGKMKKGTSPEGKYSLIEYKGETSDIVQYLCGCLRSGFTYSNAKNIKELRKNFQFKLVTKNFIS